MSAVRGMRLAIFIGTACLLAASAGARADTEVFGHLHTSTQVLDNGEDQVLGVSSNASRFGIRGQEQLTDRLTGSFHLAWEVDTTDDRGGDDALRAREQWLGLTTGRLGTLRGGRQDTPYKASTAPIDPLSDTFADYNNVFRELNLRPGNVLSYHNRFGAFGIAAAYIPDLFSRDDLAKPDQGSRTNDNNGFSAHIGYGDPTLAETSVYGVVAYTTFTDPQVDIEGWRFGGRYGLGSWTFGAVYEMTRVPTAGDPIESADTDNLYLTSGYHLSERARVHFAYGLRDGEEPLATGDASLFALGYVREVFERAHFYGVLAHMRNGSDSQAGLSAGDGPALFDLDRRGETALPNQPGDAATALSFGITYDF